MQVTTVAVLVVLVIEVEIVIIVEIILPRLVFSLKKLQTWYCLLTHGNITYHLSFLEI